MKTLILTILWSLLLLNMANGQRLIENQKLVNSDRQQGGDSYGCDAAVDGNYSVVGAFTEFDIATIPSVNAFAGAAYTLKKDSNGIWRETQKLIASDRRQGAYFGYAVDIDNDYIVVGAPEDGWSQSSSMFGKVYVFKRGVSGVWSEIQKIHNPDSADERFGWDVAIDGNNMIVGCPSCSNADSNGNHFYSGAVFFYKLGINGLWQPNGRLYANNPQHYGHLGWSVDLQGTTAIVGHIGDNFDELDSNGINDAGSVSFFVQDSTGGWHYSQKIVASNRQIDSDYGYKVSLDNNVAAVSAPRYGATKSDQGIVYLLEKDTLGNWGEIQKIVHSNTNFSSYLGFYLDIEGGNLVAGAFGEEFNHIPYGVAYYYRLDSATGQWKKIQRFIGSDSERGDKFGGSVAINQGTVFVGASEHELDPNGQNRMPFAGAVYTYTLGCPNDSIGLIRRGKYLVAPPSKDGSYSWVRCDSLNIAVNQNSDSILVISNGFYQAVLLYNDGCVDTSDCFYVGDVGSEEFSDLNSISIYPNPTSGFLSITGGTTGVYYDITISNIQGKIVKKVEASREVDLSSVHSGVYLITISFKNSIITKKIIVE